MARIRGIESGTVEVKVKFLYRKCLHWRFALAAIGAAGCLAAIGAESTRPPAAAEDLPLLQPFVMIGDFQGPGLGQWASYPVVQDNGYDPTLAPTAEFEAPGGRALMRIVRPGAPGPVRIGFIKHVPFIADQQTRFSLAYRLEAPGANTPVIDIGLAGASGRLYRARVDAIAGAWTSLITRASEFAAADGARPNPADAIEAIYVLADLADASPDVTYRLLLDDVRLSANRTAAFAVAQPAVRALEPWPDLVSLTGYEPGATVQLEVVAPARMTRVEARLAPPRRGTSVTVSLYDDGTHGDARPGDGRWANAAAHVLAPGEPPGLWTATISGQAAGGAQVETRIRLRVRQPAAARPRLFGDRLDRTRLQSRTTHPRLAGVWATMRKEAATSRASGSLAHGSQIFDQLGREHLLPSLRAYFDLVNRGRRRIAVNALVGYVTGDTTAIAAARQAMLEVAHWDRWAPPWFEVNGQATYYPAGLLSNAVALGYDLLHAQLTDEERHLVRRALIERSILPTWREYVLDNRVIAHTSNWIGHTVGGALVAAAAIEAETSPDERAAIEPAIQGLLLKFESHLAATYLPGGSYGEGIAYQEFDLESVGPALHALEQVFGIDYWSSTHVVDSLAYGLATLADPPSAGFDMGDSKTSSGHGIASIVARTTDAGVRWYANHFEPTTLEDFLFFDGTAEAAALPLSSSPLPPGSRQFTGTGHVVFRSGWERDAAVLLSRAGPTFNHNHADQGSFQFRMFGETLVTEAGLSAYYDDPFYPTFFTQAVGHNTVLVDGRPDSQHIADTAQFRALDAYPRLADVLLSEGYDAMASDLASVYGGRLSRYRRWLVFMKPHYLIVYDDLEAAGPAAGFNWLLHLPDRDRVSIDGQGVTYTGINAALSVRSLRSGDAFTLRAGRYPHALFATAAPTSVPPRPGYLELQTSKAVQDHRFLVALVPGRTLDAARATADALRVIDEPSWTGVRVARGDASDLLLFRTDARAGESSSHGWTTDASAWTTTHEGDRLTAFAAHGVTRLARFAQLAVEAAQPVSIAVRYDALETRVVVSATEPTDVHLPVPEAPRQVQRNGASVGARYDAVTGTVTVAVPKGSSYLRISGVPAKAGAGDGPGAAR